MGKKTAKNILKKCIAKVLKDFHFINVGTCNASGKPNVAPKFLLKYQNNFIYLVDYVIATTYKNIMANPRVSLSAVDLLRLTGYQINGHAKILNHGPEYKKLMKEYNAKQIEILTTHVIKNVRNGKSNKLYEASLSDRAVIIKIIPNEFVEIMPSGDIRRFKH